MIDNESKLLFSDILEKIACNLDVTETEFITIKGSYEAVGRCLSEGDDIKDFNPLIYPQGSFLLGTVVRPICEDDDLDIDLVCVLEKIPDNWTQYKLKHAVGNQLKSNELYRKKLDKEGKRCWTLNYGENKYHLDVLPSIMCKNSSEVERKYFNGGVLNSLANLAIHITDNTRGDYYIETNKVKWLISNPKGYAQWFFARVLKIQNKERRLFTDAQIEQVPKYSANKNVLQRTVQLLKRHRDKMFGGDEDKPISIIITTLAAHSCPQGCDLYTSLKIVAQNMDNYIDLKVSKNGAKVRWVANPVNKTENFADRWVGTKKGEKFDKWLKRLREDLSRLDNSVGEGLDVVTKVLCEMFGEKVSTEAVNRYAETYLGNRKNGILRVNSNGILGTTGVTKVKAHNFFGNE